MPQQNRPPLPCQAPGTERALTSAQPKITPNWREWLDLPSMGWVTDGGEVTADWTVA